MRIATMIISLLAMLLLFVQSCAVAVGEGIVDDEETTGGGVVGIMMAVLFVIGAAFVLRIPWVSVVAFGLAGLFGLLGGATTDFSDLTIWGIGSLILAVMAYFGTREGRKQPDKTETEPVPESEG